MLERLVSPEQFAKLNGRSRRNNSSAAVPLFWSGDYSVHLTEGLIFDNYEGSAYEPVLRAAMQSYAVSTGDRALYRQFQGESVQSTAQDISSSQFLRGLATLPRQEHIEQSLLVGLDRDEILSLIERNRQYLDGNISDEATIYSPYFLQDSPHAQSDVTEEVVKLSQQLKKEIEALQVGKGSFRLQLHNPTVVTTINSVTRTHLLPTAVPFNTVEGDFDSGNCDQGLATSLARGDKAAAVATFGDQTFVVGTGVTGWVKNTDIAGLSDSLMKTLDEDYQTMYYAGNQPHFYTTHDERQSVLFPGDIVYRNAYTAVVLDNDRVHGVSYSDVGDINSLLIDSIKTPQEFVNFAYGLTLPYMWANFDCAEIIRRSLRMSGISVRKYSQDMMDDLLILGEQSLVADASELGGMNDGLYIVNLLVPAGTNGQDTLSTHLYLDAVQQGEHNVFSQAFQIVNGVGTIDTPVGPYLCEKEALAQQIKWGRKLTFAQIAVYPAGNFQ